MNGPVMFVSAHDGDAFDLVRDVLADTGTAMKALGARSTSLEDVFLAADEEAK